MSDYADKINNLVKQNVDNGGDGNFYKFAPVTNTYYQLLSSMLPDKKLGHCVDLGCFLGDFGNHLLQNNKITSLENLDCSIEAIKQGKKKNPDSRIIWNVDNALTFHRNYKIDLLLLMGILEKYSLKQISQIMHNCCHVNYILVSFTISIMKNYNPQQFIENIKKYFKLYKEVDYKIHYRESYEINKKPATFYHKFLLFGRKI